MHVLFLKFCSQKIKEKLKISKFVFFGTQSFHCKYKMEHSDLSLPPCDNMKRANELILFIKTEIAPFWTESQIDYITRYEEGGKVKVIVCVPKEHVAKFKQRLIGFKQSEVSVEPTIWPEPEKIVLKSLVYELKPWWKCW